MMEFYNESSVVVMMEVFNLDCDMLIIFSSVKGGCKDVTIEGYLIMLVNLYLELFGFSSLKFLFQFCFEKKM